MTLSLLFGVAVLALLVLVAHFMLSRISDGFMSMIKKAPLKRGATLAKKITKVSNETILVSRVGHKESLDWTQFESPAYLRKGVAFHF